jgi:hypothetical protein
LYRYVGNNPISFVDPSGKVIVNMTGQELPPEVVNSQLYRSLDSSLNVVEIVVNNDMDAYGLAEMKDGYQIISINVDKHYDYDNLVDTYIHELNHVDLNNIYNGNSSEEFDTDVMLPGVIEDNFGQGGISYGACIQ